MNDTIYNTQAAARFSDEKLQKINLYASALMFCDVYCLKPGQAQKLHEHADNDKVYHALTGQCDVILGDTTTPLPPGHTAIAPAGVPHGIINNSITDATVLVMMAPHPYP